MPSPDQILNSLGSRAISIILGAMGSFYGLFGIIYLSIGIDWILLIGSVLILVTAFSYETKNNQMLLRSCL
ncbi:MAG: hypothetical protein GY707_19400 [Desulfobacteraceae bacterium]|nr:hypothetical protein [Desulfobacteraceae bacterium]